MLATDTMNDFQLKSITVGELLTQVHQQGAPLRIDDESTTYYVLSADQLAALFEMLPNSSAEKNEFTMQDFALSESDVTAYQQRREQRRKRIDSARLTPLDQQLAKRLAASKQKSALVMGTSQAVILQELEAAIAHNMLALTK